MSIGQIDNVFKPLRFENLSVSEKARIKEDGKEFPLADLSPGTGVFLDLQPTELALVVVGIERIAKTKAPSKAESRSVTACQRRASMGFCFMTAASESIALVAMRIT